MYWYEGLRGWSTEECRKEVTPTRMEDQTGRGQIVSEVSVSVVPVPTHRRCGTGSGVVVEDWVPHRGLGRVQYTVGKQMDFYKEVCERPFLSESFPSTESGAVDDTRLCVTGSS